MKHFSDEELERALFSLDLEEPPADLRGSILAGTCYRTPAIFKPWETAILGAVIAIVAWVAWTVITGDLPTIAGGVTAAMQTVGLFLSNGITLAWIAVGGSVAVWLSLWANQPGLAFEKIARR